MQPTFETFEKELNRLVASFANDEASLKSPGYAEARLRADYLDPFFRALGWDLENKLALVQNKREVEIESRVDVRGRAKRADYLFRTDGTDRFVCEAKKPREDLDPIDAFQAKRYAWNKSVALALLSDFEEMKVYVVGSRPHKDRADEGEWKVWHYRQYPLIARELWDLFSREKVAAGAIDSAIAALPKRSRVIGKARQQWLIKPDRNRSLDNDFLAFLDEERRSLGSDLLKHNFQPELREVARLTEAVQRILDRLLFLRICEDRDIDTGTSLAAIVETWRRNYDRDDTRRAKQTSLFDGDADSSSRTTDIPRESLWFSIVRHFRALDRRPPTHVPFFNGNLFKHHFCEDILVGDQWLCDFIGELSDDESPYLFHAISVEILGNIYERFLGKIVRPQGRGVTIEEKPEVRKAGGVYYTPRYIVDYIVEQTLGRQLEEIAKAKTIATFEKNTRALRALDPACGSGSFLIRVFERICEHWQSRFLKHPAEQKPDLCWRDPATGDIHLTVELKRRILRDNVYGVDLDAQAVEVTQLSLYLKMLEGENRTTLQRQREFLTDKAEIALLPPLQDNIKHGNSLIASDFSLDPDDLIRVNAFDWEVKFKDIMRAGGFDAVVGNPPYIRIQTMQESDPASVEYLGRTYASAGKGNYDIYVVFVERVLGLLNVSGQFGYILPHKFFNAQYGECLRAKLAAGKHLREIVHFGDQQVFEGATTYTCLLFLSKAANEKCGVAKVKDLAEWRSTGAAVCGDVQTASLTDAEWNFNVGPDAALMGRLSKMPTLGDIAARMGQGIRTSANEVYVLDVVEENSGTVTAYSEILQRNVKLDRKSVLRFLQGREIKSYILLHSGKVVIMPYRLVNGRAELVPEQEFAVLYPQTYDYLLENKAYLSNRERGKMKGANWYGYVYPKNLDIMQSPKILVPDIADRACYGMDADAEFAFTSGYGITLKSNVQTSPLFILGLLNSGLLSYYIKRISTPMRGGFFRYFTQFIEKLPIPTIDVTRTNDKAVYRKMVDLVEGRTLFTAKLRAETDERKREVLQNAIASTDQKIDALVYELYGLTAEEIALVEGSAK